MADTIELEIVTPERQVVRDQAEAIQIPGRSGYLVTELAVGEITYTKAGVSTHLAVAWGFAEVLPDRVTILAEVAELAEDIDVPRAEAARDRAQQRLNDVVDSGEYEQATLALARAEARIAVAKGK